MAQEEELRDDADGFENFRKDPEKLFLVAVSSVVLVLSSRMGKLTLRKLL